jgi:hypothetical protein
MTEPWADPEATVELTAGGEVDEADENGRAPDSLIEQLRARRSERAAEQHVDLEVPGWDGIVLRLGPLDGRVLPRLRERYEKSRSPDRDFNLNADTLIAACRSVHARLDGRLLVITDADGEPCRVDARLAERLGIELPSGRSRELLLALFHRANSPEVAIATAANRYVEWASSATSESDEELLGES